MAHPFNPELIKTLSQELAQKWDNDIIPQLQNYIRIPNKSPFYDPDWEKHGYMKQAMDLIVTWCRAQNIPGMQLELLQEKGRTPLLYIEIPGQIDDTVLLYGHMDKQPEMSGWEEGLGPWIPVLKGEKLYGRGGADDGYSTFAALTAIQMLQKHGIPHGRCVIIVEACEESGSADLPFYLQTIKPRIGEPNLVICLDSGAGNYEQLWSTTSLRGNLTGELSVEMLSEGIHSGVGSGVVANPFMILRHLLDRVENPNTSEILVKDLFVDISDATRAQAKQAAEILGDGLFESYPLVKGAELITKDPVEFILNRTWRPALSVTGVDGLPSLANAGNVTIPKFTAKLSWRVPAGCALEKGVAAMKKMLEENPPFHAKVEYKHQNTNSGWSAPALAPWLKTASDTASQQFFGKPTAYLGEGGSIPFMAMLGEYFPKTQFLITGVLGPHSNAHGPNEFLHVGFAKKLTGCVASVVAAHFVAHKK